MEKKIVIARVRITEGKEGEFMRIAEPLIENARKEPGNLAYSLYRMTDDPQEFVFYEEYTDADAFKAHGRYEHYKTFSGQVKALLAKDMDVQIF